MKRTTKKSNLSKSAKKPREIKKSTLPQAEIEQSQAKHYVVDTGDIRLKDIIGQQKAIDEFRFFARLLKHPGIAKQWKCSAPKGILLVGPPGTGKTASVRALANEVHNSVFLMEIKYRDIASRWIDANLEALRNFLRQAEQYAKQKHVLIFIDEIDGLLPSRDQNLSDSMRKIITAFLEWLDGGFNKIDNITIIGSTNHIAGVDSAVLRPGRMDKIIEFHPLTNDEIIDALKVHINKLNLTEEQITDINWSEVLKSIQSIHLSGAEVAEICRRLVRQKASEHMSLLEASFSLDDMHEGADFSALLTAEKSPSAICTADVIHQILQFRNAESFYRVNHQLKIGF